MKEYNQLTVREALSEFYNKYNIPPDGGINDTSVKVELIKGFSIYIPNCEARRQVLLRHDIHHTLTGYTGVMKGETEISAWEMATGCRHNWVALFLNYFGMVDGALFNLKGVWKAFVRGKRSHNLYKKSYSDAQLLGMKVEDLREELGLEGKKQKMRGNYFSTFLEFSGLLFLGIFASVLASLLIPFILLYSLYIYGRKKWVVT